MAIVVASMVAILITAGAVLLAVFVMHEIASSPQARIRLRRWALAAAAGVYSVRRVVANRGRHVGRFTRRRLGPHVSHVHRRLEHAVERMAESAHRRRAAR